MSKLRFTPELISACLVFASTSFAYSQVLETTNQLDSTRTVSFERDTVTGAVLAEISNATSAQHCLRKEFSYDSVGNVISTSVRNCTAPAPAAGTAVIAARISTITFAAAGENPANLYPNQQINPAGHTQSLQHHNAFGIATQEQAANGLVSTTTLDPFGRPILRQHADGNQTRWQYDYCSTLVTGGQSSGSVPALTPALPALSSCPTGAAVRILEVPTTAAGMQNAPASATYLDAQGRTLQEWKQQFATFSSASASTIRWRITSTGYDNLGRVANKSEPYFQGDTAYLTTFTYDALGRVTQQSKPSPYATGGSTPGFAIHTTQYNGRQTIATNPRGHTQTRDKDEFDRTIRITDAQGNQQSYLFDAWGNLHQTKNALGHITSIWYDQSGHKSRMIDPDMGQWQYAHDPLGQLRQQVSPKGQTVTLAYDTLGRMTQRAEPELISNWYHDKNSQDQFCGTTVASSYNSSTGQLCEASTTTGYKRSNSFDGLARISSSATVLDGNGSAPYISRLAYDANSRIKRQLWPSGFAVDNVYDNLGFLTQMRVASNAGTGALLWQRGANNARAQFTQVTYGNSLVTNNQYELSTGLLQSIQTGAASSTSTPATPTYACPSGHTYNPNIQSCISNTTVGAYANSVAVTSSCVEGGILRPGLTYSGSTACSNSATTSVSQCVALVQRNGLRGYAFHGYSSALNQYVCNYRSDRRCASGMLANVSTNGSTNSNPDDACRPITTVAPQISGYQCSAGSTLSGDRCYSNTTADASVINHSYNYNALGHLIRRDDANHNTQEIFQYDELNRLNEQMLTTAGGQLRSISTRYNAIGNILSQSDVGDYTYATPAVGGRPHALASINGQAGKLTNPSYSYDLHGNIAAVTSSNGAGRTHTWTSFDNPDALTLRDASGNTASINFLYGPEHQRIREVTSKTTAGQTSQKTLAVLHPDNEGSLYFERETINTGAGAGTAQNRHYLSAEKGSFLLVTSNGAIQSNAQSSSSLSNPTAVANAEYKYWHKDHLGSIVASTNSNLTVIERLAYEPFGKRRFSNGSYDQTGTIDAQSTNRGFTGHEHLDELDFIHMNARVYDPDIHRFLSPDPTVAHANNPQSFNRYAYAYNNPLNLVDPSGFQNVDAATGGSPEEHTVQPDATVNAGQDGTAVTGNAMGANNPTKSGKDDSTNGLKGQDIPLKQNMKAPEPERSKSLFERAVDWYDRNIASPMMGLGPLAAVGKAPSVVGKGVVETVKAAEVAKATAKAAEEAAKAAALAANANKNVAKGVSNPSIAKGTMPDIGMSNKDLGKTVGWGSGAKDAAAKAASITDKEVAEMQKSGLTKDAAKAVQDFYTHEFGRNSNNMTAAHRADLMGKIAEMMK